MYMQVILLGIFLFTAKAQNLYKFLYTLYGIALTLEFSTNFLAVKPSIRLTSDNSIAIAIGCAQGSRRKFGSVGISGFIGTLLKQENDNELTSCNTTAWRFKSMENSSNCVHLSSNF